MEILIGLLAGTILGIVICKTIEMAKEDSNTPGTGSDGGWGGSSPAGEVPKDVKK